MKKTFLTLMFLVVAVMTARSQTTLNDAIKSYFRSCPSSTATMTDYFKNILLLINTSIVEDFNGQDSEALLSKYMKTRLLDDFTECVYKPAFEGHITIAELNELTNTMLSPQGKLYQAHSVKVNFETVQWGENMAQGFIDGKSFAPISLRTDCPKSYVELYNKYYDLLEGDQVIEPMLNNLKKMAESGNGDHLIKMAQYIRDNVRLLCLNHSYGVMTTDDLNFGIKLSRSTAYQHLMETVKNMPQQEQTQEGTKKFLAKYMDWLENQGVKMKE